MTLEQILNTGLIKKMVTGRKRKSVLTVDLYLRDCHLWDKKYFLYLPPDILPLIEGHCAIQNIEAYLTNDKNDADYTLDLFICKD